MPGYLDAWIPRYLIPRNIARKMLRESYLEAETESPRKTSELAKPCGFLVRRCNSQKKPTKNSDCSNINNINMITTNMKKKYKKEKEIH